MDFKWGQIMMLVMLSSAEKEPSRKEFNKSDLFGSMYHLEPYRYTGNRGAQLWGITH